MSDADIMDEIYGTYSYLSPEIKANDEADIQRIGAFLAKSKSIASVPGIKTAINRSFFEKSKK
jgi:hypothetical protein